MRDIKYGAGIIIQSILKDFFGCDVQMVGRLVEDQEICFREHQFRKRYTSAFPTAQRTDLFEDIITGKKKCCKHIPDFRIRKSRIIIGNLVKNCFLHMKDMMFLVVVANLNIGAKCISTGISRYHSV